MTNDDRTHLFHWRTIDHALTDWRRADVSQLPDGSLQLWLQSSGGAVHLIHPPALSVPEFFTA